MAFIKAQIKFKNGELWEAVEKTKKSLPTIAKEANISYTYLIGLLNLKIIPKSQVFRDKLCFYLGVSEELIFEQYESLDLKKNKTLMVDIPKDKLISYNSPEVLRLPAPAEGLEKEKEINEFWKSIERILNEWKNEIPNHPMEKSRSVKVEIFLKHFKDGMSIDALAVNYNCNRETIRLTINKCIRKLRERAQRKLIREINLDLVR